MDVVATAARERVEGQSVPREFCEYKGLRGVTCPWPAACFNRGRFGVAASERVLGPTYLTPRIKYLTSWFGLNERLGCRPGGCVFGDTSRRRGRQYRRDRLRARPGSRPPPVRNARPPPRGGDAGDLHPARSRVRGLHDPDRDHH